MLYILYCVDILYITYSLYISCDNDLYLFYFMPIYYIFICIYILYNMLIYYNIIIIIYICWIMNSLVEVLKNVSLAAL